MLLYTSAKNRVIWMRYLPLTTLLLAITFSTYVILQGSGRVPAHPMDQGFASVDLSISKSSGTWRFEYPKLSHAGGISASLTVGLYKLLLPIDPEALNWHVRTLGATLFLTSAALLFWQCLPTPTLRTAAFLLVATSGYQFIEPTSELIAGSYIAIFFTLMTRQGQDWSPALALALFGLTKVELGLASTVVALVWAASAAGRNAKILRFGWYTFFVACLVAPALYLYGSAGVSSGRAFDSFIHHYDYFLSANQNATQRYEQPTVAASALAEKWLPHTNTMTEVITNFPFRYLRFVALSTIESAVSVAYCLKGLIVILAMTCWYRVKIDVRQRQLVQLTILVAVLSLLPALALAFVHIRYVARFFPEIVLLAVLYARQLSALGRDESFNGYLLFLALGATVALQIFLMPDVISNSHGF